MSTIPEVERVERRESALFVRFRDPEQFGRLRTPESAQEIAESVSPGSEVRTGKQIDSGDWEVQSVLIEEAVDEDTAAELATTIVRKLQESS